MKFIAQHYTKIIFGILGATLMFLFMRSCDGDLDGYRDMKTKADSLLVENKTLNVLRREREVTDSLRLIAAHAQTAVAKQDVEEAGKKLSASQNTIARLTRNIEFYKGMVPDSNFVLVAPGYVANCDSLAHQSGVLNKEIDRYRAEATEVTELMNYEIVLRDSIIEQDKADFGNLQAQFTAQATVLKNALDAGKPRGRFLAGAGIIGNQTTPLSGAKIAFAYQTRGGKQYQGGAVVMNKTLYYEGTILITLFK